MLNGDGGLSGISSHGPPVAADSDLLLRVHPGDQQQRCKNREQPSVHLITRTAKLGAAHDHLPVIL
jgi:hypothetical protein